MRKGVIISALIMIAGILLILASFEVISLISISNNQYDVLCEVKIENALFQDAKFQDESCLVKPSSILPFSVTNAFSVGYYDSGNVKLQIRNRSVVQTYKIAEGTTAFVRFRIDKLVPGDTTATFTFYNENGGIIDTKSIPLNIGG